MFVFGRTKFVTDVENRFLDDYQKIYEYLLHKRDTRYLIALCRALYKS